MSSMFRILVEADEEIYAYAKIQVSPVGDVYIFPSMGGSHISRHASGRFHIEHEFDPENPHLGIHYRVDIKEFKGIEGLSTFAFGAATFEAISHPQKEKYLQEPHFLFNARDYKKLNLQIYLLTEEGVPDFLAISEKYAKHETYLLTSSRPMVGVLVFDYATLLT